MRKFDINSLYICPPHLYTVATWEIQKSHFQQYYSYTLQIIYIISEENKLLPPYPPHLKNVIALPCKKHNLFIWLNSLKVCSIPPNVSGSEKRRLRVGINGSEKTACDVWQMECQTSNVTANVQSDHLLHGYMFPVFFVTDQLHHPPRSAEI